MYLGQIYILWFQFAKTHWQDFIFGKISIFIIVNLLTMKKQCLECGEAFSGRMDAKFCSNYCRSSYHNKQKSDGDREIKKINSILRKNRKILATLNTSGIKRIHRNKLMVSGFNFNYLTNTFKTARGKTYKFCYDQGYIDSKSEYLTLVVKKDYVG